MHVLPLPKLIKWSGLKSVNSFDHLLENKLSIKDMIMGFIEKINSLSVGKQTNKSN